MSNIIRILAPALLALAVSFLTYHYQFRKNNRFLFLNRVRHLIYRIDEALRIIIVEKQHIETLISNIDANPLRMHLLGTTGYPALKFLYEKVIHEDYFIAFSYIFKNTSDGKKEFERLHYATVLLNTQFDMTKEMTENALKKDYDRRIKYINLWHESEKLMTSFVQNQRLRKEEDVPKIEFDYFIALTVVANGYFGKLQSGEIEPEIGSIQEYFIEPVRAYFKEMIVFPELIPYSALLDDINYIHDDIIFQNKAISKKLKEDCKKMQTVIEKLGEVKVFLSDTQITPLYG